MKVTVKDLAAEIELKNNGMELEIRSPDGNEHLGDLVITKTNIIWCEGRQRRENGKKVPWQKFIELMNKQ